MNAMRKHRARADQPEPVIHIDIVPRLPEPGRHRCDFADVFRQVRVQQHVGMGRQQFAGHGQLLVGTTERKARRYRITQPAAATPGTDQRLGFGASAGRRIGQPGRAQIHQDFATGHPHRPCQRSLEQGIDRMRMHRRKHQRAGRAVAQKFIAKRTGHTVRMGRIGKGHFGGENMPIKPVEQLFAVRRHAVHLRIMHMRIDKTGHDQPVQRFHRHPGKAAGQFGIGPARNHDALFDHQQPVRIMAYRTGNGR